MAADPIERVIAKIHSAALEPSLWAGVLRSVAAATGAIGAAYIVRDPRTGRVDSAIFLGPTAKFTSDYMNCFGAKDPFVDLLADHDGLTVRNGALGAARVFESAKLGAAIVSATRLGPAATSSRILIGRRSSKHDYILAVSPLGADLGFYSDPMALIVVVDPDARAPRAEDLSAYFGLSVAEARLATQLMSGKPLGAIAAEFGASTATLRAQLSSILTKSRLNDRPIYFLFWPGFPALRKAKSICREKPSDAGFRQREKRTGPGVLETRALNPGSSDTARILFLPAPLVALLHELKRRGVDARACSE